MGDGGMPITQRAFTFELPLGCPASPHPLAPTITESSCGNTSTSIVFCAAAWSRMAAIFLSVNQICCLPNEVQVTTAINILKEHRGQNGDGLSLSLAFEVDNPHWGCRQYDVKYEIDGDPINGSVSQMPLQLFCQDATTVGLPETELTRYGSVEKNVFTASGNVEGEELNARMTVMNAVQSRDIGFHLGRPDVFQAGQEIVLEWNIITDTVLREFFELNITTDRAAGNNFYRIGASTVDGNLVSLVLPEDLQGNVLELVAIVSYSMEIERCEGTQECKAEGNLYKGLFGTN